MNLFALALPEHENHRIFPTEPGKVPYTFLARYICSLFTGENPAIFSLSMRKYPRPRNSMFHPIYG